MTDTWETTVRTAATTMLRYPERISAAGPLDASRGRISELSRKQQG